MRDKKTTEILYEFVSIHASRFREAMPLGRRLVRINGGVSIHASRFREAMPGAATDALVLGPVSIHASRFREAMRADRP